MWSLPRTLAAAPRAGAAAARGRCVGGRPPSAWAAAAQRPLPRRGPLGGLGGRCAASAVAPGAPAPAVRSELSVAAVRPSSFRESQEQVPLSERQEAILVERLPRDWNEEDLNAALLSCGVDLGGEWRERVLVMRSRLGRSTGRALVATAQHAPHVVQALPMGSTYRPMDRHDVESFVEQCERFVALSEDLRRLARPEHFHRVLTITGVPSNYGRRDVVNVMKMHCGVTVDPRDVIFRFKRWGRQSDTCYVILPTVQQVDHCIQQIQELAVPKRAAYGALFGATFLWSSRAALFLCHPDLDFLLHDSKFWVFTTGWQEDMGTDEFMALMNQMQFCPVRAVRHPMEADRSNAFFMELDGMEMTKRAMIRLRRLKWRWRMKREVPFLAYPRRVDIHRLSEDQYEDEDSAADSDIDEPVHY